MYITIVIRKEVQTLEEGDVFYNEIIEELQNYPDLKITDTTTNHE